MRRVALRPATEDDIETTFRWQSIPLLRRYFHNTGTPTWDEHSTWFRARLCDPDCLIFIIQDTGEDAGVLRLERTGHGKFMVSILVDPKFQGNGVGREALVLARRVFPAARLEAEILPQNKPSESLFKSAGYLKSSELLYVQKNVQAENVAIFWADYGVGVGLGHINRCIGIAHALRAEGWDVAFLSTSGEQMAPQLIVDAFPCYDFPFCEADIAAAIEGATMLIVDNYRADIGRLAELRNNRNWLLCALDDAGDRALPVDLVVNGSLSSEGFDYKALGAKEVLLGTEFQVIRRDLLGKKISEKSRQEPRRLLVTIGGGDPLNIGGNLLDFLENRICRDFPNVEIDFVVGPFAEIPRLPLLPAVRCHYCPVGMTELIAEADVAVSAAGQTLLELLYCGVPTVAICMAENQKANIEALVKSRCALQVKQPTTPEWQEELEKGVRLLLETAELRGDLSVNGARLIDGKGATRLASRIVAFAERQKN